MSWFYYSQCFVISWHTRAYTTRMYVLASAIAYRVSQDLIIIWKSRHEAVPSASLISLQLVLLCHFFSHSNSFITSRRVQTNDVCKRTACAFVYRGRKEIYIHIYMHVYIYIYEHKTPHFDLLSREITLARATDALLIFSHLISHEPNVAGARDNPPSSISWSLATVI